MNNRPAKIDAKTPLHTFVLPLDKSQPISPQLRLALLGIVIEISIEKEPPGTHPAPFGSPFGILMPYFIIASIVPAATAVPMTPATFGPMACMSR